MTDSFDGPRNQTPADLVRLATWLDSEFRLPGNIRIGWDGILGLIPGIGDLLTSLVSIYIIGRAAQLGCPPSVLVRMGAIVLFESLVDMVPVLGNLFDVYWKSNERNLKLIERHLRDPDSLARRSRWAVGVVLGALLVTTLALVGAAAYLTWRLFS